MNARELYRRGLKRNIVHLNPAAIAILMSCTVWGCNKNPASSENQPSIVGTWNESGIIHYDSSGDETDRTFWDAHGVVSKKSFFENGQYQYFRNDSIVFLDDGLYTISYLLYGHHMLDDDSLHSFPDSLMDVSGTIRLPNSNDDFRFVRSQDETVTVVGLGRPTTNLVRMDDDIMLETWLRPTGYSESVWERIDSQPRDFEADFRSLIRETQDSSADRGSVLLRNEWTTRRAAQR